MELIDKAVVVAEIKRRIILLENNSDGIISMLASGMFVNEYKDLLSFIDTLEVKEVDLKEERMKDCPYRVVRCEKYSGTVTECNGACAWVTDYLTLKELKAKKGE